MPLERKGRRLGKPEPQRLVSLQPYTEFAALAWQPGKACAAQTSENPAKRHPLLRSSPGSLPAHLPGAVGRPGSDPNRSTCCCTSPQLASPEPPLDPTSVNHPISCLQPQLVHLRPSSCRHFAPGSPGEWRAPSAGGPALPGPRTIEQDTAMVHRPPRPQLRLQPLARTERSTPWRGSPPLPSSHVLGARFCPLRRSVLRRASAIFPRRSGRPWSCCCGCLKCDPQWNHQRSLRCSCLPQRFQRSSGR
mmetsp:Transcript_14157/g.33703  ORF Transcript_14157/g.33703 Transcript_14157/m.33703 type:complete len:248 (-) Transcript_14157:1217-1960(-)